VQDILEGAVTKEVAAQIPGQELGWAIVGLGNLAIHESCPLCEKCENPAYSSGERHPDKANKLAQNMGESEKHLQLQNYDSIKDNPKLTSFTFVLADGCMPSTRFAISAGKQSSRKAHGQYARRLPEDDRCRSQGRRKLMVAVRCRYEP